MAAADGLFLPNGTWGLRSPADMAATVARARAGGGGDAREIAAACDPFSLDWLRPPLPTYPLPERYPDDDSYLRRLRVQRSGRSMGWGRR